MSERAVLLFGLAPIKRRLWEFWPAKDLHRQVTCMVVKGLLAFPPPQASVVSEAYSERMFVAKSSCS